MDRSARSFHMPCFPISGKSSARRFRDWPRSRSAATRAAGSGSWLWVLLLAVGIQLVSPPAGAELVVFSHGGFIKVDSFVVEGDQLLLGVPGGKIRVPMARVERILEDENPTEILPEPPLAKTFLARFDPAHLVPATPFGHEIFVAAERHDLNPDLVAAVIRAESGFDARAVSLKGAQGLMQLMPATASRFGLTGDEVFDPVRNLDAGSRYLSWLVERFDGQITHALAAYNAGEGTVDRYGGVPPYGETRRYLRRIFFELGLPVETLP